MTPIYTSLRIDSNAPSGEGRAMKTFVPSAWPASLVLVLSALSALTATRALALEGAGALTLERVFSDPPLEGRAPMGLQLSPSGKRVTFLQPNDQDSDVLDLWGVTLPDGKPRLLVATTDLLRALGGGAQKLTEQERMALERKRITKRGITSSLWCGRDARTLVFPFSGDLYVAALPEEREDKHEAPVVTRLTHDEDEPELSPVCSANGDKIAFVKKGDVLVADVPRAGRSSSPSSKKAGAARRLTKGGGPTRTFGLAEFIAEEEMDRHEGMWWSPDGRSLLVFEVDESAVGVKVRAQIFSDRTELVEQRYPAAGEKNAVVTAWLVDVATGKKTRLLTPDEDGYLPRAGFFPDGRPWVQWQSRDQRRLALFELADGKKPGALRQIFEENDEAWVELHDDLVPLADGQRFLWSSEQSGRRQIVLVDRKTGAFTAVTAEPEAVEKILAVDKEKGLVFFSAYRDRGRQLQVFSQRLAGPAGATLLTPKVGWHSATFDDAGRFFVDKHSDVGQPPRTTVHDAAGREVFVIDDNPAAEFRALVRPQPRWIDVKAEDGTMLNGLVLPPAKVESGKRYPVVTFIYGGPTAITVRHAWSRHEPVLTHWTQRGWGVFLLDNRGMGGRDRAFGRAHHRRFGDVEVKDLFAGVTALKAQVPWVDGGKIGVFGWSYGGFLAARAVLDENTPFRAAVAVAPVTDWTLYDTHYTERYLGLPVVDGKAADAYSRANLVSRARLLSRPLLLVHGTADDNVLFEHTLRLTEGLTREGKLFDLMIYPGKAHGISGKAAQLHVYKTISAFFDEKLR